MTICKEIRCINVAKEVKIFYAQQRLDNFCKKSKKLENPLSGIKYAPLFNSSKTIKQLAFIPIGISVLFLLTPVMYAINQIESYKNKISLKKELNHIKTKKNIKFPKNKTLKSLWEIYGLEQYKYTHDERMDLLSKWITILYCKETLERLNISQMASAIGDKNSNLNHPYFEDKKNVPHYYVKPIVEILIEKLSESLPVYGLVDENTEYKTAKFASEEELFEIPEFIKIK
jgi:hypothetical protein